MWLPVAHLEFVRLHLKKMMIILWYTLLRTRINHLLHLACLAITGKQHICMVTRWLFVGYSGLPVVKHFYSRVTQKILSVTTKYSYKLGIQMKNDVCRYKMTSSCRISVRNIYDAIKSNIVLQYKYHVEYP